MRSYAVLRCAMIISGLVVLLLFCSRVAHSDRCSCPPPPVPETAKQVYEPAQRAVLLWTGREELLFLSTDLYSPEPGLLPEVLALPAQPLAAVGDIDAFGRLASLLGPSRLRTDWLPQARRSLISLPLSTSDLADGSAIWSIVNPCKKELLDYRDRGYNWAVVDWVSLGRERQSFSPVEYRFASDFVYYPLRISVGDSGPTQVDLVIISRVRSLRLPALEYPIEVISTFSLSMDELRRVSTGWADFMSTADLHLRDPGLYGHHVRIRGDISRMHTDFIAQ